MALCRRYFGVDPAGSGPTPSVYGSAARGYDSPAPQGGYGGVAPTTPARHTTTPGLIDAGLITPVPMATPAHVLPPPLQLRPDDEVERLWAEGMALLSHRKSQKQVIAPSMQVVVCMYMARIYFQRYILAFLANPMLD